VDRHGASLSSTTAAPTLGLQRRLSHTVARLPAGLVLLPIVSAHQAPPAQGEQMQPKAKLLPLSLPGFADLQ